MFIRKLVQKHTKWTCYTDKKTNCPYTGLQSAIFWSKHVAKNGIFSVSKLARAILQVVLNHRPFHQFIHFLFFYKSLIKFLGHGLQTGVHISRPLGSNCPLKKLSAKWIKKEGASVYAYGPLSKLELQGSLALWYEGSCLTLAMTIPSPW